MNNVEVAPTGSNAWIIGEPYKVTIIGTDGTEKTVTLNPVPQMIAKAWSLSAATAQGK